MMARVSGFMSKCSLYWLRLLHWNSTWYFTVSPCSL